MKKEIIKTSPEREITNHDPKGINTIMETIANKKKKYLKRIFILTILLFFWGIASMMFLFHDGPNQLIQSAIIALIIGAISIFIHSSILKKLKKLENLIAAKVKKIIKNNKIKN